MSAGSGTKGELCRAVVREGACSLQIADALRLQESLERARQGVRSLMRTVAEGQVATRLTGAQRPEMAAFAHVRHSLQFQLPLGLWTCRPLPTEGHLLLCDFGGEMQSTCTAVRAGIGHAARERCAGPCT